jgi:molecular chaperone GrpE
MNDKQELEKLKKDLTRLKLDIQEKSEDIQKKDDEIQNLEDKVEDSHSQLLRLHADFDNYKKRTEKEFKEYVKYANEDLIIKILDVYEDLERALNVEKSHDLKEGVEMIYKNLKKILEKEGLYEIKTVGEQFDTSKHDGLMVEDNKDFEDNTVIEELCKGYTLNDKVIKYPKVKICKKK